GNATKNGKNVEAYACPPDEVIGINTRSGLYQVSEIMNKRNISKWMARGVTFIDPSTSIVHLSVTIGKDTIIYPNTYLEGVTLIGKNCIIYPGVRICDSILKDGVSIRDNTLIEHSKVRSGSVIGPFTHLRPQSNIGRNVKIGNFVEVKKSRIGDNTRASHLSYLGDAVVGKNVNIGAGTITCNYDGIKKHTTIIESGVFIGSDSQIVAPVKIGEGAYVASGSTVTRNVPAGSLAISRARQENLKGWTKKKTVKN
ncbi:MAG: bifunctional UDP-N-acetylglucosamine diphosphorylase/glucosamine-1-phosphate N-acetyltransferase GlmU, partial [Candidatus Mariimomonas ferrooxydans]